MPARATFRNSSRSTSRRWRSTTRSTWPTSPMPPNVTAVFETNEAVVTVLPPTVEEVKVAAAGEGAPRRVQPPLRRRRQGREGVRQGLVMRSGPTSRSSGS